MVDRSVAAAAVARAVTMGSEPAPLERLYAVQGTYFFSLTSSSVESVLRDAHRRYKVGPANVTTNVLMAALRPQI